MKRLAFITLGIAIAAVAAIKPSGFVDVRPSPRIDILLHCSNAVTASGIIVNLDREIRKATKLIERRNLDVTLVTNGVGSYTLQGTVFLESTNQADVFIDYVQGMSKPAQVSGRVVIHHCPGEDSPEYRDWAGCKDDSRAGHREVTFP